jgi:hypothetical protein
MSNASTAAQQSILIQPPSNPTIALVSSLFRRSIFVALVAFSASLAQVLPVTLANIPYRVAEPWEGFVVCTYFSLAVIGVMLLTLGFALLHKLPKLPLPSSQLASVIFYLSQLETEESLARLSALPTKERNKIVQDMGLKYILDNGRIMSSID